MKKADTIVRLEQVIKNYGTKEAPLTVLKDIDLSLYKGEFIGIIGASGSGKTTLMNILGCLDKPSKGRYFLEGSDVSQLNDNRLSAIRNQSIGFVFQSFNLVPELTVIENIEVPLFYMRTPKRQRKGKCMELLDSVGLSHRIHHYPTQLSGGECQRTAIARALVNDPTIVMADEPTGNLDSKTGVEILNLFHKLHQSGRTIIMVTHNIDITYEMTRVVELSDGQIISDRSVDKEKGAVNVD